LKTLCERVFKYIDKDGSGQIDSKELDTFLREQHLAHFEKFKDDYDKLDKEEKNNAL